MEPKTEIRSFRIAATDYAALRQMAGPGGASRLVRTLIRTEAARRELLAERPLTGRPKKEARQ